SSADVRIEDLQHALSRLLPSFMLPSRWLSRDSLPLTSTGKVDRKALSSLHLDDSSLPSSGGPPRGHVETLLSQLFLQVLSLHSIERDASFFHLGGHSLSATRLVSRIRHAFGVQLPLAALFASPTVASLARELTRLQ
ncbi:hypothetical protein JGU66_36460, partial [Myxococcaceae bacterium JPH2]|nr:hypothetical protein [Myxococcaceae bacterium JPH2]